MSDRHYFLRTCSNDGGSYGGFQWPLEIGAEVEAPDWDPAPECGGGLHGLRRGVGNVHLLSWEPNAVWLVFSADAEDVVVIDAGKSKVRRARVEYVGHRAGAADFIVANGDACPETCIGYTAAGGDCSTLTGGYHSTMTGGDHSTITGGDHSTLTGGYGSTLTGGDHSTLTGGDCSTLTGGDGSTLTGGDHSTLTGGYHSTITGGYHSTLTGGDCSTLTGGYHSTMTGGYHSTITGGDHSTLTGGYGSTITGGYHSTITGGYGSTLTGGDHSTLTGGYGSTLIVKWWDGESYRRRIAVGCVGEGGIEAGRPYRIDDRGQFIAVDPAP